MDKLNTETEGQESDDPEATGKECRCAITFSKQE